MFRHLVLGVLIFSFTVTHSQASVEGLRSAYNELTYTLEVEWDQKNPEFKKEKIQKFHGELEKLQEAGLTNAQLLEFALSEVKDTSLRKEIQTLFTMVRINSLSKTETYKLLQQTLDKNAKRGASWNGDAVLTYVGVILFVVAAIYVATLPTNEEPKPLGQQPDGSYCGYSEVCGYEYDYFYEEDVYECWDEYHCVKY